MSADLPKLAKLLYTFEIEQNEFTSIKAHQTVEWLSIVYLCFIEGSSLPLISKILHPGSGYAKHNKQPFITLSEISISSKKQKLHHLLISPHFIASIIESLIPHDSCLRRYRLQYSRWGSFTTTRATQDLQCFAISFTKMTQLCLTNSKLTKLEKLQ